MTSVSVSDYQGWLKKGLGRTLVYLKTHDSAPYREAIMHACTHNVAYDTQCEDSREEYLWNVIHASGHVEYLRAGLVKALRPAVEEDELSLKQILDLLCKFARNGDLTARNEMYAALTFGDAGYWYEALIRLDGISALVTAVEYLPDAIEEEDLHLAESLFNALRERDGDEQSKQAIQEAARRNPRLRQVVELVRDYKLEWEKPVEPRMRLSYPELKEQIYEKGSQSSAVAWGRTASQEERQLAAADLRAETDEDKLIAYLGIFRFDDCPGPIDRFLELAEHDHERIQFGAIRILSRKGDDRVRTLAMRLLANPDRVDEGIELLASNYQQGDYALIETALRRITDTDVLHSAGLSLKRVIEKHFCPEALPTLLLMYELGPCSLCRETYVDYLLRSNQIPESIREECQFDASEEIRKMVGSPI